MKNSIPTSQDMRVTGRWRAVVACTLITLVGFNIRSVILAVPPVLPLIQHDLALSYAATGFLTALPTLVLGGAAWISGLLIEQIGARSCVTIGLALLAAGTLLRALLPSIFLLFLFTLLLSIGIVLAQTAIPVLTRWWFPLRIGLVAALFTDGLIIGETVGAGATVPLMTNFLGKDAWAATFIIWGIPVVVLALLWLWLAPPAPVRQLPIKVVPSAGPESSKPAVQRPRVNALHLGIMLGAGSLIYFGMNGWIASYNLAIHHAELTPLALTLLNGGQLPLSLLVTLFAQRLAGRRWTFVVSGIVCALSITAWVLAPAALEPFWATLLGASSAFVFTLGIALPPLLARPDEVARLTGTTISLTYGVAFIGPFLGGALWDFFHLPPLAFLPVLVASALLVILGALLPPRSAFGLQTADHNEAGKQDVAAATQQKL